MSFNEAETVVKSHMKVGRTFDGKRAFDAATARLNEPMTSGKLFVSEDGREVVAILDEPPAAKGRVVAAWRRVYVPGGAYAPEEIFSNIKKKYGAPTARVGDIVEWYHSSNRNCENLYGPVRSRPLVQDWADGGNAVPFNLPNPNPKSAVLAVEPLRAAGYRHQNFRTLRARRDGNAARCPECRRFHGSA
jgi:hypothetical protein